MTRRLLIGLCPMGAAVFLMAVFAYMRWPLWQQSFMSDFSPAAWLSSAQLLAAAMLAFRLGVDGTLSRNLSAWLTLALFA